ncbi:MAG TPA: glycosyltransferase N-terminal domain-containing protein [Bdellovibrionales bacterium]|nr:glycosyltransferase N-terminal domain-containing protein [Bdellovibrionales bacterium]
MIWVYRLLVAPLAVLLLPAAAVFNSKIRQGLRMRMQRRDYPHFPARPIWIHAASGEFEYAKAVIRELKSARPDVPVIVTYFSPTYARQVESFPGVDFALPLPLDLPGPCASFLRRLRPRALWLARTDFWPEMLTQTRRRGIPIAVFALTQKPVRGVLRKFLTRWRLRMLDKIYTVSPTDRETLSAMGIASETIGDTRYDQVAFRLNHPKPLPLELKPTGPTLIAGSTWPEDESALLPALGPKLKSAKIKLILVPHEPTPKHLEQIEAQLQRAGLTHARFSQARGGDAQQVLIVDQVGILAELYAWASIAFIGGSFKKSVHSVMEGLGAGLPTIVGPYHLGNREAVDFQNVIVGPTPAVLVAWSSGDLSAHVERLLSLNLSDVRARLRAETRARQGASRRVVTELTSVPD